MSLTSGKEGSIHLDVLGLFLAGLINTFLASFVAVVVVGPGSLAQEPDLLQRVAWISEHPLRWQAGWLFWFAVTLSFAWSYYAIGRHLESSLPWTSLAIGLALVAAAVDIVGVLVYIISLPELAYALSGPTIAGDPATLAIFQSLESLANALVSVAAFGLYSFAGLLLLPAAFSTRDYPRWLLVLGMAEWGIAAVATILLILLPDLAFLPLLISFGLYAPWAWANGIWLVRRSRQS